jgi:beta-lactamase regulating signal transducer with metallopeptidase domain/protocatechuate 3,4-dioxygenase beta subunit
MTVSQTYACLLVGHVTCLACIALIGMWLWPRSASLRHTIGVTVGLFILICPITIAVLPDGGLGGFRESWRTDDASGVSSNHAQSAEPRKGIANDTPVRFADHSAMVNRTGPEGGVEGPSAFGAPVSNHDVAQSPSALGAAMVQWPDLVFLVWGSGSLLMVWRLVWRLRAYQRYRKLVTTTGVPCDVRDQPAWRESHIRPVVLLSRWAPTPLVLGGRTPCIVLPEDFGRTAGSSELDAVLRHELAHLERGDGWVLVAQQLVTALYWWHPLIHGMSRAITRAREEVCDNHVLGRTKARDYAELLLQLSLTRENRMSNPLTLGLLHARWNLETRIRELLDPSRSIRTRTPRWLQGLCLSLPLAVTLILGGLVDPPAAAQPAAAPTTAAKDLPGDTTPDETAPQSSEPAKGANPSTEPSPTTAPGTSTEDTEAKDAQPPLRKITIHGRCYDETDRSLAGVRIRIYRWERQIDVPPDLVADLRTDEQGLFRSEGIGTRSSEEETRRDLYVLATHTGHATSCARVLDLDETIEIPFELYSQPISLAGDVKDEQGRPVAGALVSRGYFSSHDTGDRTAVTDEHGRFEIHGISPRDESLHVLRVPRDPFQVWPMTMLRVHHPDYAHAMIAMGDPTARTQITLPTPAIVTGRVVDAVTGRPVSNVRVGAQEVTSSHWGEDRTDDQGYYRLRLLDGRYNIFTTDEIPDRVCIALDSVPATQGKTVRHPGLLLVRGAVVHGVVIDEETNQPVQRTTPWPLIVGNYGPARPKSGAAILGANIETDGSYRLRVAPGENHLYLATQEYYGGTNIEVHEGEERRVDLNARRLSRPRDEGLREMILKKRQEAGRDPNLKSPQ